MISKWQWLLSQLTRTLWIRAALFALLAVVTALIAIPAQSIINTPLPLNIGADAVGQILNILASSMLAVTTFSLSVMVAAYSAASNGATPRATKLVQQDTTTQNVLATFIGSFLFSLVGIIALSTDVYDDNGRLILFIVTIGIIILIVVTMLRWIEHLSQLGRLGETSDRVEKSALDTIRQRVEHPTLGGRRLENKDEIPDDATAIFCDIIGYVRHIDVGALQQCAKYHNAEIGVLVLLGEFVHPAKPKAWFKGQFSEEAKSAITASITLGNERSFSQDPRFGLMVLAEIASRALSPAVNDPGTAIDILNRAIRILIHWKDYKIDESEDKLLYPNVWIPELSLSDLFDDIFMPIGRDGASMIEVQLRLQKALEALADNSPAIFGTEVSRHLKLIKQRAEHALVLDSDKQLLQPIYNRLIK